MRLEVEALPAPKPILSLNLNLEGDWEVAVKGQEAKVSERRVSVKVFVVKEA